MSDAGTPLPKVWQSYVDKLEQRIAELEAAQNNWIALLVRDGDARVNQAVRQIDRLTKAEARLDAVTAWCAKRGEWSELIDILYSPKALEQKDGQN